MAVGGPANTQREARQNWTSAYPFEIANGGLGVGIDATTTSQRAALTGQGNSLELNNMEGLTSAYFAWGDSSITATTSHYRVEAGFSKLISIAEEEQKTVTHVACVMASGTARVMVYRGNGN